MAIYSKKSKDATEVALSAIQDALNIRDADAKAPGGAAPDTRDNANDMHTGAPRSLGIPGSPGPAREALDAPLTTPGGDDEEEMAPAANDDRESIGQILQSLQRRPASTAFITSLFAAAWAFSALLLIYGFWGPLRDLMHGAGAVPTVIGLLGAF